MEELYVVIGTDAFDSWICSYCVNFEQGKYKQMLTKDEALQFLTKCKEEAIDCSFKVAKLTPLD